MENEQQETKKKHAHKWKKEELEQIKSLIGQGYNTEQIAQKMNSSVNAIKYLFEKRGGKDNFSVDPLTETFRPMQVNLSAVAIDIVNVLNVILKKLSSIEQQIKELGNDSKN